LINSCSLSAISVNPDPKKREPSTSLVFLQIGTRGTGKGKHGKTSTLIHVISNRENRDGVVDKGYGTDLIKSFRLAKTSKKEECERRGRHNCVPKR